MNEDKKLTTEQANKLLKAIFSEPEGEPEEAPVEELTNDNYPETVTEKVGYAEYVMTHDLQYIGQVIHRLSRLHNLLLLSERNGHGGLPDIITNNELRIALRPLMQVENNINEITAMLMEIFRATKPAKMEDK